MDFKFDLYDILGVLVPGVLLSYIVIVLFPVIADGAPDLSAATNAVVLTAAAVFVGQVIQAIGSLAEPFLFFSFGGDPAERAIAGSLGDRYFPAATAIRIREKLQAVAGQGASERDLYFCAMQRAEGLSTRFSALYAYHRALIVLVVATMTLCIGSAFFGWLSEPAVSRRAVALLAVALIGTLALVWHRARQRAFYYVTEVFLEAERVIDRESKKP